MNLATSLIKFQVTCSLAKTSCPHVNHKPHVNLYDQGHELATSHTTQRTGPSHRFTYSLNRRQKPRVKLQLSYISTHPRQAQVSSSTLSSNDLSSSQTHVLSVLSHVNIAPEYSSN